MPHWPVHTGPRPARFSCLSPIGPVLAPQTGPARAPHAGPQTCSPAPNRLAHPTGPVHAGSVQPGSPASPAPARRSRTHAGLALAPRAGPFTCSPAPNRLARPTSPVHAGSARPGPRASPAPDQLAHPTGRSTRAPYSPGHVLRPHRTSPGTPPAGPRRLRTARSTCFPRTQPARAPHRPDPHGPRPARSTQAPSPVPSGVVRGSPGPRMEPSVRGPVRSGRAGRSGGCGRCRPGMSSPGRCRGRPSTPGGSR